MLKFTSFKLFINVVVKFVGVFLGIFSARWLNQNVSAEHLETYNLILPYSAILLSLINFGIPTLVQKYYTNEKDVEKQKTYWSSLGIFRILTYFIGILIIFIASNWVFSEQLGYVLLIFTSQFILLADINFRSVCDANNISWKFSLTDNVGKLLLVVFLVLCGYFLNGQGDYLSWFLISSIIAYSIAMSIDFVWHWKYTGFSKVSWNFLKSNVKNFLYLGLSGVMVNLYFTTDRIFLKYFGASTDVIVGYSNAYKIFELSLMIPGLTMPILATIARKDIENNHTRKLSQLFINHNIKIKTAIGLEWLIFTLVFGIILAVGVYLLSSIGIWLIDPSLKYPLALQSLPILVFSHIVYSSVVFLAIITVFFEKEHYELISSFVIAIFATISYFVLIPRFSLVGAALATLLTFFFDFLVKFLAFWHILRLEDAKIKFKNT